MVGVLQLRDLVLDHLDPGRVLHQLRCRVQQRRSDLDLLVLADPRHLHPHHRLHDVGARVGLPDLRGHLLVGVEARRSDGGLLHRLAQPDRARRGHGRCLLRVRDLHRPHDQHVVRELRRGLLADPRLHHLPGRPAAGVGAEHLQQSPDGGHEQRVGVVARRRCGGDRGDPAVHPRPAPVVQLRLHRALQQLGLLRRGDRHTRLLVRHRPVRLPADAVHDHRLRRLRAPVGGDRRPPRPRPPRASGSRSSTR